MASFRKKVKSSDSDEAILSAIYKSEIDETARRDAELKAEYERLKDLKPDKKEYQQKLKERIEAFTKLIPIQNRTNLTKYVARRKLVLQVFNMILERELNKLSNGERIDEDILHNLIFQQGTTDASSSDLWLINEEYLYYKGSSEKEFKDIEFNGEKIFSREFTEEELTLIQNDAEDFWQDLVDEEKDIRLGIVKEDVYNTMYKIACSQKAQMVYAGILAVEYEDLDYASEAFLDFLSDYAYEVNDKVLNRLDFGDITLIHE